MSAALEARSFGLDGPGMPFAVLTIVLTIMATMLVIIRTLTRTFQAGPLGNDDYAIWAALMFAYCMGAINLVAVTFGFGRDEDDLPESDYKKALMMFWLSQIAYKLVMLSTKYSLLLLYLRIFPNKRFRIIVYCLMVFVAAYILALIGATIGQCIPVSFAWEAATDGQCIDIEAFWYSNASLNITTDVVILVLPLPYVYGLHLPKKQKIYLSLVFLIGGFVCLTSVLRMTTLSFASSSMDRTSGTLQSTIWTTVEAESAIICACLPVLRTAATQLRDRLCGLVHDWSPRARDRVSGSIAWVSNRASKSFGSAGSTFAELRWQPSEATSGSLQHVAPCDEETMIPMVPPRAITKRTEIEVVFEEDCSSSSHSGKSGK